MLDLQFLCDNLDLIRQNGVDRGVSVDLSQVTELAARRRQLIAATDDARREQKETAAQIPQAKEPALKQQLVEQGRNLREKVAALEVDVAAVETALRTIQLAVPNLTHPEAPRGSEADSKTIKTWGQVQPLAFPALDHVALCQKHSLLDLEAGARVTGHGFYFLKNEGALLELALTQLAVQHVLKAGFTLHITPDLARMEILEGTGYQPRGDETQIYSIANTDLCLVATAEITLGGSLKDQILEAAQLPIKYAGISHCFRTEAGAHGKASRGIYRVHQFTKVEMFAFTGPDLAISDAMHREILAVEEAIFQDLEVPYRVLDIASGDLGGPAYRKFDIEAWMPGRNEYGEVTSASNCTDFQARRLGVRCKSPDKKGNAFVHTLNGTAVACTRAMIAVLENHQQADGSIRIPKALQPWMGTDRIG